MRAYLLVLAIALVTLITSCGKDTSVKEKKKPQEEPNTITFSISGKIPLPIPQDDLTPEAVYPLYPVYSR